MTRLPICERLEAVEPHRRIDPEAAVSNWHRNPDGPAAAATIEALYNGCNALLGLIQLLAANRETPPAMLRILTEHHRIAEAEKAITLAEQEIGK